MVFNNKRFFLELEDASKPSSPAPVVAPVREISEEEVSDKPAEPATFTATGVAPEEKASSAPSAPQAEAPAAPQAEAPAAPAKPAAPSLTTAEAIAAELAAAEAARPEVKLSTFAVDALQPGNALRPQKRRPGANLRGFRSMAAELFKSSSTGRETSL